MFKKCFYIAAVIFLLFVYTGLSYDVYADIISEELDKFDVSNVSDKEDLTEENTLREDILRSSELYNSTIDVLDVKDVEINEVLDIISEKTGFNIVALQKFPVRITIYLTNIDVFDALRVILDANGLAYYVKEGTIYIVTDDTFFQEFGYRFGQKLKTEIVSIKYGDSKNILNVLDNIKSESGSVLFNEKTKSFILIDRRDRIQKMIEMIKQMDVFTEENTFILGDNLDSESVVKRVRDILTENVGMLFVDAKKGTVTVRDTPTKLDEIQELISSFERKNKKLTVASTVIQVTLNDEHLDGVDWSAIVSSYKEAKIKGFYAEQWGSDKDVIGLGTILTEDYSVLLEALDTVGIVREVSKGREEILTSDTAKVFISSDELLLSESSYIKMNKKRKNEEARFFIRPSLFGNDELRVDVAGVVVDLDSQKDADEDLVPTQIKMKIGDILVIGGLYKEELIMGIKRIPIVGKIPFLGSAFKKHKHDMKKTEVIIFIKIDEKTSKEEMPEK